jgi:hypothetical protein
MTSLPIAVRVYPELKSAEEDYTRNDSGSHKKWRLPDAMLVFDTETRIDATQRLTFGSYRFIDRGECLEEGLFYASDLPAKDRRILEQYISTHKADTPRGTIKLLTLNKFLTKFYRAVYKGRCLLVGFNLPFDLSRLARSASKSRGRFAGGFSFELWSYKDSSGAERSNQFRPRIAIKHIDGKRALKGFTARNECDQEDLIPEESIAGEPQQGFKFRGHFLDLRTLTFAITDKGHSLSSACEAFEVEHGKQHIENHGVITDEYIDYNRRDVLATEELAIKLLAEYRKNPINLQPTKAYSSASIGKSYLEAMGIRPILERQPNFPKKYLGYAQSAFFGGRTSAHIRKSPVPIVYTDFLSMYPTVNCNMDLWNLVTADKIQIEDRCKEELAEFFHNVSAEYLFKQNTWKKLTAFILIVPNGDILPSRSKYSAASNDWQVAVNRLYAKEIPANALWFSLPDVVVSVLLTGRIPHIIDGFRLRAIGKAKGLKSTKLRGDIEVKPHEEDFFKAVIEQRKSLAKRTDLSKADKARLDKALKVIANSASYGIYAEMNRQESDQMVETVCYGIDQEPFTCNVTHPEVPGKCCFPLFASLITGAARLKLALLEHCVTALGGTYAMEDTDSMAIVATKRGGLIPCSGGSQKMKNGEPATKALSWKQVEDIATRFATLNPYDRDVIPGSILKIEEDNFDPKTGKQRQLYCVAISAKRYALFLKDRNGEPELLRKDINNHSDRWSEHGLGHLLNPSDPESDDRKWVGQAWLRIIRKSLDLPTQKLEFEDRPAIGRLTVSSPALIRPLSKVNEGKPYAEQIKPFNFLLTCHVKAFGHPMGADPANFHLIAPYNNDPRQWLKMEWIDQYSGNTYRISTNDQAGTRRTSRVKTYGDVLREYEFHPESKCADAAANVCERQTIGLLHRRHVEIDHIRYIGKESNQLEAVEAGLVHSETGAYTEYVDPTRDEWVLKILPILRRIPLNKLIQLSGLSKRALLDIRAGRSRPHAKNRDYVMEICRNEAEGIE